MPAENPAWRRVVQFETPQWRETSFIPFDVLRGVKIFDTSGRPVFESPNSKPKSNRANIPYEQGPALPDGGRKGKKVNVSAFTEVADAFDDALGLMSHIRDVVASYDTESTPAEISRVMSTLIWLPHWLVMKSDNPMQNGRIPTYVSAVSKMAQGATRLYTDIETAEFGAGTIPKRDSVTYNRIMHAEPFVTDIFDNRYLISMAADGQELDTACPAPWQMIMDFAEVLFEAPTVNKLEVGQKSGLSVDDINRAEQFATATRKLRIMSNLRNGLILGKFTLRGLGPEARFLLDEKETRRRLASLEAAMNSGLGRQQTLRAPAAFLRTQ